MGFRPLVLQVTLLSNPIWANDLGCISHSTSQDPGVRKDKERAVCAELEALSDPST